MMKYIKTVPTTEGIITCRLELYNIYENTGKKSGFHDFHLLFIKYKMKIKKTHEVLCNMGECVRNLVHVLLKT